MHKLVLIRHGESTWNLDNRFTGWTDVDLTETGIEQAKNAGRLLHQEGYEFDLACTSVLKRAIHTLWQVLIWRRSYDTPPPALEASDERSERADLRYAGLGEGEVPLTECLKDTVDRVMPFWNDTLAPAIRSGQRVMVSAHGNSIRALVKYLDSVPDADIVGLNIPNGIPLVYELDADLKPIRHYYLGDAEAVAKAAAAVAAQGKA